MTSFHKWIKLRKLLQQRWRKHQTINICFFRPPAGEWGCSDAKWASRPRRSESSSTANSAGWPKPLTSSKCEAEFWGASFGISIHSSSIACGVCPWRQGLESAELLRSTWNPNSRRHTPHGCCCQGCTWKLVLAVVGIITKWQEANSGTAGLRTTWETCKETKNLEGFVCKPKVGADKPRNSFHQSQSTMG